MVGLFPEPVDDPVVVTAVEVTLVVPLELLSLVAGAGVDPEEPVDVVDVSVGTGSDNGSDKTAVKLTEGVAAGVVLDVLLPVPLLLGGLAVGTMGATLADDASLNPVGAGVLDEFVEVLLVEDVDGVVVTAGVVAAGVVVATFSVA